jgi:hypothetical protein
MRLVRPLVDQVMRGINSTLICTGPATAGKTHSLFGNGTQSGVIKRVRVHWGAGVVVVPWENDST